MKRISSLCLGADIWISGDLEIRNAFTKFFGDLYTTSRSRCWGNALHNVHSSVSDEQNLDLSRAFSANEVQKAVTQLGTFKAPSPNSFLGFFYSKYWEIVCDNVNSAVNCFYMGEFSVNNISKTNIVLIPKVPHSESISQFRSISLWRQIQDNLILAHEAYHYLKLKKSKVDHEFALKLDMNKAYDRVEWDFLDVALLEFGFCSDWFPLVMKVVSSVSFSILINGKQGQPFTPTRGLRQGDPLSPYLFLIVGEVLSKSIITATCSNHLQQIKLSTGCLGLSRLLFADDSLFFLKATPTNCNSLKGILDSYCTALGQSVNLGKSSIFFSAFTPLQLQESIASTLNIRISDKPGIYLGLPTHWGNSKKSVLAYIRERNKQKLEGWKANVLSQAGREVLIKAVAMAVPAYPVSIFLLPVTLCKALNFDISNFWWGFLDSKDKLYWKA
ncbi:hypothetical protein ACLB2K_025509 [Fragaria x ananassa]